MLSLFYYRMKGLFYNIGIEWDEIAQDENTAIDFAHKNINQEPNMKINSNKYSIEYYLAHFGEDINKRFREDRADQDDMKIADMIALHTIKVPLVLYRGVHKCVFRLMIENARKIKGVDLYEKSFLQTSLVKGHETNNDYHLRIYVPSGIQAVYLGNVNNEQSSYEVVIQHGVKLKIVSIDDKYINCRLI